MEVLGLVEDGPAAGRVVAVRQGRPLATAFHPEVTGDHRFHELFVEMVRNALAEDASPRSATGTRDADAGAEGGTDGCPRRGHHAGQ